MPDFKGDWRTSREKCQPQIMEKARWQLKPVKNTQKKLLKLSQKARVSRPTSLESFQKLKTW